MNIRYTNDLDSDAYCRCGLRFKYAVTFKSGRTKFYWCVQCDIPRK